MRRIPILLALLCLMSACARPNLAEPGASQQEGADIQVVRSYFAAINAKNQAALSKLLADNVTVLVGEKSWGKATELAHRVEAWTRDPNYTTEITSILLQGGLVRARVMVTFESHGVRGRQEIENTFSVQRSQIVQATLAP